jgi:WD40 repeat protein/transcriptional regulator with XRE-family HTH domain
MTRSQKEPVVLTTRDEFGDELTRLRERAGLSVRDLATAVKAPLATVGGYLSGRHLPNASQTALLIQILAAVGVRDPGEVQEWSDAAIALRRSPAGKPSLAALPYRGLFAYRREDADLFFGREDLTVRIVDESRKGGLSMVVGPSGAGKSSLLRAGLLAAWPTEDSQILTPGVDPNATLDLSTAADRAPGLLVIDQFEEIFTVVESEEERARFIERIERIAATSSVVLGMRADFYSAATRVPLLVEALQQRQVVVGALTEAELGRAILGPAARAGLTIDPELVRALTDDLTPRAMGSGPEVGALPLLSHALREVCLRAKRGRLTLADYHATGGISGAIQQSAERVWAALTPDEQETARRLFLRMVNMDEDSVITRRPTSIQDTTMRAVLAQFIDERLITADSDTVGISHEALLNAWPRLHDWVSQDRTGLANLRNLRSQAAIWADGGEDPSALLRGSRLSAVSEWLDSSERSSDLDERERSFLRASQAADVSDRHRQRRQVRTLRMLVAAALVLLMIAGGLAISSSKSRSEAQQGQAAARTDGSRALSRQLAVNAQALRGTDPNTAAQLALLAYRTSPTVEARSALLDSTAADVPTRISGHDGPTFAVVNAAHKTLAVSDDSDGTIHLYGTVDPQRPTVLGIARPAINVQQFSLAFTADGRYLIGGSSSGTITTWDVHDPAHPGAPHTFPAFVGSAANKFTATGVNSMALSPDGHTLIAAGTDVGIAVFALDGGRLTRIGTTRMPDGSTPATTVSYSPDGSHVVATGGDVISMWTSPEAGADPLSDPTPVTFDSPAKSKVNVTAFSPDGTTLVVGPHSGLLAVYKIAGAAKPTPVTITMTPYSSWINALTFSADGTMLAAGSSDSSATVFSTADYQPVLAVKHPSLVTGVQFLNGTDELVTASTDGGVRIWSVPGPSLDRLPGSVYSVDWSKDSTHLIATTGATRSGASLFDVSNLTHPALVKVTGASPANDQFDGSGAFASDSNTLAVGLAGGPIQLWDMAASPPRQITAALAQPTQQLEMMAFSGSGHLLAGGGDAGLLYLWDTTDPAHPKLATPPITEPNQIYGVAFSPDEKYLAVAVTDDTVRLWDISNPAKPRLEATLTGFSNYALSVSFSRDGRLLAASGADRTIQIWSLIDPAKPVKLGKSLIGPSNQIDDVEFSPDGTKLVAASLDKSVWVWDITDPSAAAVWAQLTAAGDQAWVAKFSPDGSRIAGASVNNRVSLWASTPAGATQQICGEVGAPITPIQWATYLPDQPYAPPCP